MKNLAQLTLGMALISLLSACGSTKLIRRADNDPMLRVMIDPTIPAEHYVQIKAALVESGKFEVIDRRDGFEAALREQDLQFRSVHEGRFDEREKWMWMGRMYGAMGIITANAQCYQRKNWLGDYKRACKQFMTFVNGATGKIEFSVRGENEELWTVEWTVPDWDDVVAKAVKTYPEYFEPRAISKQLKQYMEQSEERSKRERARREAAMNNQASVSADVQKMRDAVAVDVQSEKGE